jgi:cyanate permease
VLRWSRAQALRDIRFWSVTTPFAFAITAQAGFLVHQIAYLSPVIGREPAALAVAVTTGFAVIGRVGLGFVIDRLDHRMASAVSFLSQTLALGVMAVSDSTSVLLVCCAVYGVSVGNLITFPALIIQREFAPASFGMLIGLSTAIGQFIYAFGPGLIGIVRDASGGYTAALILCGVFNAIAAVIILMKPRFSGMVAPG